MPSAAGGAPGGDPRHTPPLGDVPALSDILAHLDSPEYLDTLNQLAESLLKEIDANSPGAPEDVSIHADDAILDTYIIIITQW